MRRSEGNKTAVSQKFAIVFFPGGGFGDMIVSLPILDFILKHFPHCDIDAQNVLNKQNYIDIIGPERAARLRNIYEGEDQTPGYHAWFECHEFVKLHISEEFLNAFPRFKPFYEKNQTRLIMLQRPERMFPAAGNQLANFALKMKLDRVTLQQWTLGFTQYEYPTIEVFPNAVPQGPYITINDGWNSVDASIRVMKAWAPEKWRGFVEKARCAGLMVVQIGSDKMGESYDVDLQLRGKLSLRESLGILARSSCHVDIEGGLVHAAAAIGTRSVVLHGPTNAQFFSYKQNANLIAGGCQGCWWMTAGWGSHCIIGQKTCMEHTPKEVLRAVKEIISRGKK